MMVAEVMIRIGSAKSLKTRGGGLGGAAAPPMMFEELMIQLGLNLCRKSKTQRGGWGGGSPRPHDVGRSDDSSRGAMIQERVR